VETPSSAPAYKPGDVYGPVAPGEGLWGIALKIRPEGITREQMMQALFKANPQAFSSAGIDGLKIGATLRIPTYREIADFTGSAVARRLAAVEEHPATPVVVADRTPLPSTPEVFPLALVPTPEPVAIIKTPTPDSAPPASLTPSPPIPEPVATIAEPEPKAPQMPEPESESPRTSEPVATAPEKMPGPESEPPTPRTSEPVAIAPESDSLLLEPISATPLLFLAVSEIIADAAQMPMVVASEPAPTAPPAAEPSMQVAVEEPPAESSTPVSAEEPPVAQVAVEEPPVAAEPPAEPPVSTSAEEPPVAAEPPAEPPVSTSAEEPPVAAESPPPVSSEKSPVAAEPPAEPPTPVSAEEPPSVVEPPSPAKLPDTAATQTDKVYRGGDEYGPVSNNERLWDIATKVRPDPDIGRDIMMKALFLANPQAFAKPTMDHLKAGSVLRIPTLQEIVKYTDSTVAKSLLEQQRAAESRKADPGAAPVD
jgi:FimV-like protein